ncbi:MULTISPECIES: antibiotic biosynthesis monooxygenase [unclassified Oceanobacter]|jgi:heme-degrading monooxygenase HmoA|uniref:antibiotic biosynthesis monooxygenase family protein n=1 Tax=unclassified Oceanobacter TaxID=2620260 RepID=UPI0026E29C97|nr:MULTISPECIES: antibiotic biosynthesis monooxygenase [unclassified Oceanobacter]MDO6804045.1 antibiotic biosynthesis monooxygenase [Wenyingzhuangia sp. 1_MG-2023]MDO6683220.1 antibiotic biosynthesis monooxygenase [Oceanobacter sp. 5_MG-2023]MDP2506181.1 antibiotic biosynthesis monooxygenase [Oceanobacter sp. 3_MG-2023]MDP2547278.1 antibiotic biosynthesis monooxygenase [Oceanobacter sp. 4_MG-2023]MDP2607402.1 antibiotic biosynthesis monooxygenase [Oceanobacter sp. 1_MG-2023]
MIKVIIDRRIADDMESTYEDAIKQTLQAILEAPGYVSGASYKDAKDSRHRIIITNWKSLRDWEAWAISSERKRVIAAIQPILMREERFSILTA